MSGLEDAGPANHAESCATPSLADLTSASLKIGCLSFGGPAAQIAMMHRVFVEEKRWIDEKRYLNALNYCMLLPGPEAQQLATYVGWLLHGVKGGIIAGLLFVLPGAAVVLGLSWLYVTHGSAPLVEAAFFGVRAAVLAFVLEALQRIGKRALKGRIDGMIAGGSFLALTLFAAPFPLIIILAGLIGAVRAPAAAPVAQPAAPSRATTMNALRSAALWLIAWTAPIIAAFVIFGPDHVLTRVGVFFSKLALVTFGGAYAVLAWLRAEAVDSEGWLTAAQMIDGLGLAETTPGPLVLVNQFVGFLAGWQGDGGGVALAIAAAAMASWATFAPSFLWIFAGAPYAERLSVNPRASGALRAVTAAVLGVIANLALWFALKVLFRADLASPTPWGTAIGFPELISFDLAAALIAVSACVALMGFHVNALIVIGAAALAGALFRLAQF